MRVKFRVNDNRDETITAYRTGGSLSPNRSFRISYADLFILLQVAKLMNLVDYYSLGDGDSFHLEFPRGREEIQEFLSANDQNRTKGRGQEDASD